MQAIWERTSAISPGDPGKARYAAVLAVTVDRSLDESSLRGALQDVLDHHDALRLGFLDLSCDATVAVHPAVTPALAVEDLSGMAEPDRLRRLREIVEARQIHEFDLRRPPLWRLDVVRLPAGRTALIFCFYHLLLDGWSISITIEDLLQAYQHRRRSAPPLGDPVVTFERALRIEHAELTKPPPVIERWRERLLPLPSRRLIPTVEITPSTPLAHPRVLRFRLDQPTSEALTQVAWAERTTVYVLFQAAYSITLCRRAGYRRVIVSTTTAGRRGELRERVVGQFTRDLYVPVRVDPAMRLDAAVHLVDDALRDAIRDACEFRQLVSAVHPDFAHDRPWHDLHLFDSYIQADSPRNATTDHWGIRLEGLRVDAGDETTVPPGPLVGDMNGRQLEAWIGHTAPFVQIDEDRRGGAVHYNAALFADATVRSLLEEFLEVVSRIARNRDSRIGSLRRGSITDSVV